MQATPFLRWAGGKRQLLPAIHSVFKNVELSATSRYFEPFLGGGAVFFSLASGPSANGVPANFHLNDWNEELVDLYRVLRDDVDHLIMKLEMLAHDTSEEAFYRVRAEKAVEKIDIAARFVFLNRLCFNGLYRVNQSGDFNVPYGKLKNPVVCNTSLLKLCSAALKDAEITNQDFSVAVSKAKKGDLVYLDPPYVALTKTASFTSYHSSGFSLEDHRRLADLVSDLSAKQVNVVLSNSDTEETRDLFSEMDRYVVKANRSISAAGTSRNSVQELLCTNFELHELPPMLTRI
jgi:DNA adenine methylase